MKIALTFTALCLLHVNASALRNDQWVTYGIGSDSCASYVLALEEYRPSAAMKMDGKMYYTMANAYTQWLSGFVTSFNFSLKPGPGQIVVDVNGIALWVKNYCQANPTEMIVTGAGAFVRAHKPKGG